MDAVIAKPCVSLFETSCLLLSCASNASAQARRTKETEHNQNIPVRGVLQSRSPKNMKDDAPNKVSPMTKNHKESKAMSQQSHKDKCYSLDDTATWGLPHPPTNPSKDLPMVTLLVCADIDIDSSSALVDYTLQQQTKHKAFFDSSLIDLIVVVGPFAHYHDLEKYRTPHPQRRKRVPDQRYNTKKRQLDGLVVDDNDTTLLLSLLRTHEESCALEGLATAAIAQLENIVCRVVYCPGLLDPITILQNPTKRLTSNSRNVHTQSLPLVPGLAVAGLMHMEGVEQLVLELESSSSSSSPAYNTVEEDDEDTENSDQSDALERLSDQLQTLHIRDYETSLDRLIDLANQTSDAVPAAKSMATILVTHYVDSQQMLSQTAKGSRHVNSHVSHHPWPLGHDKFLKSRATSVCLEVAAGGINHGVPSYDPECHLLMPGSLRVGGNFSIVRLTASGSCMQWHVDSVEHHTITDY